MPTIIMWIIWKRRNEIKHGGKDTFIEMVWQVQDLVWKLIKTLYSWMKIGKTSWPHTIALLKECKPRLYCLGVTWKFPEKDKLKCNTDGACWGNPRNCASAFYVRDEKRDLIYAKARGIKIGTNTEAEVYAIKEALEFCLTLQVQGITMETDSLALKRMIEKQWKVP
ncbi:hypothetical protein RDI58_024526 [Solanum bulbocastanum]|uniref:RNase H type-1 domain-containing protein n=1 Tax=Solanum bulbocastanum TaxID=147425 RepID=A0AAN8Y5Q5_SOLBU